jgi:hypothetical protein
MMLFIVRIGSRKTHRKVVSAARNGIHVASVQEKRGSLKRYGLRAVCTCIRRFRSGSEGTSVPREESPTSADPTWDGHGKPEGRRQLCRGAARAPLCRAGLVDLVNLDVLEVAQAATLESGSPLGPMATAGCRVTGSRSRQPGAERLERQHSGQRAGRSRNEGAPSEIFSRGRSFPAVRVRCVCVFGTGQSAPKL